MSDLTPLYFLGGIVAFWVITFFVALSMSRGAMRGVGEPVAEELAGVDLASANGNAPTAKLVGSASGPKTKDGAH
jgi:hypothetical protein